MMIFLKRFRQDSFLKALCIVLLISSMVISMIYASGHPTAIAGEIDSYLLPTISLQYRGSLSVSETDLVYAQRDYPDYYNNIDSYDKLLVSKPYIGKDGQWYYYYFPIYSMAILPVKLLMQLFGQNQSKAPFITNVLLWMMAVTFVFLRLKRSYNIKLLTVLLLIFNPICHYIQWQSAEVMIFALVVMGLTCFANDELFGAAIFISISGMLNPTIMAFGMFIIVYFFYLLWKRENGNLKRIVRCIFEIIRFGACFIPCLIPFLYYYISIGQSSTTAGMSTTTDLLPRFLSYFFDLSLGYLPRFPLLLILFFVFSVIGILKKDVKSVCYFLGLVFTVIAFSLALHIQSGMIGVSRYGIWSAPIFLFFCTTQIPVIITKYEPVGANTPNASTHDIKKGNNKWKRNIVAIILALSLIISMGWLAIDKSSIGITHPFYFSPLAHYVLDHYPQFYDPFFIIFASRTLHVDGGIVRYLDYPVVYYTKEGHARKILIPPGTFKRVYAMLTGTEESMDFLEEKISKLKHNDQMQYIDIRPSDNVELYAYDGIDHIYPAEDNAKAYSYQGFYADEGDFCWLSDYAMVSMAVSDKLEKGFSFSFVIPSYLFIDNDAEQVSVQLNLDGVLMEEREYTEPGTYEITIPGEMLPKKKSTQAYIVTIRTSKAFYPEDIWQGCGDPRRLAVQLYYLGGPIER